MKVKGGWTEGRTGCSKRRVNASNEGKKRHNPNYQPFKKKKKKKKKVNKAHWSIGE
jgi:hypothetical protein